MEQSPLGKLPPELRVCIYECVLTLESEGDMVVNDGKVVIRSSFDDDVYDDDGNIEWEQESIHFYIPCTWTNTHRLALTQTCKAIYHESLNLFYKVNPFRIQGCAHCNSLDILHDFVELIGPGAFSVLRSIEVEVNIYVLCNTLEGSRSDDEREESELVALRKWSLQHPHIALSAAFWRTTRTFIAIFDVRNLGEPVVRSVGDFKGLDKWLIKDVERFFEEVEEEPAEFQQRIEEWQEELRAVTVGDSEELEEEEKVCSNVVDMVDKGTSP